MILKQKAVQDILFERTVFRTSYTWIANYEGVVDIVTSRPRKAVKN